MSQFKIRFKKKIKNKKSSAEAGRTRFNGLGFLAGFQNHLFHNFFISLSLPLSLENLELSKARHEIFCVCCVAKFLCVCLFPYTWVHSQRDPLEFFSASRHWQIHILIWNSLKKIRSFWCFESLQRCSVLQLWQTLDAVLLWDISFIK